MQRQKRPDWMRNKVASDQKWLCRGCDELLDFTYEVDHVEPLADGGADNATNLQALCPRCHRIKTLGETTERAKRRRPTEGQVLDKVIGAMHQLQSEASVQRTILERMASQLDQLANQPIVPQTNNRDDSTQVKKRRIRGPENPEKQMIGGLVEFDPDHPEWRLTAADLRSIFKDHPVRTLRNETLRGSLLRGLGVTQWRSPTLRAWKGLRVLM